MAIEVLNEAESSTLSFDTVDDARNYASAIVEEFNRRAVEAKFPDVVELYRSGQIYLLIPLRLIDHDPLNWYSIVHAVTRTGDQMRTRPPVFDLMSEQHGCDSDFVFVGVRDLVETPQGVVSSAMWLACGHEVENLLRDLFGSALSTSLNIGGRFPEWKMSVGTGFAGRARQGKTGMVESGAQSLRDVGSKTGYSIWDRLIHLGVLNVSAWIQGIWLDKHLVRVSIEESLRQRVQFGDVILGVPNGEANAV